MDYRRRMMNSLYLSFGGGINVGDVAYAVDGLVKTCSIDDWDSSMGTPVGVVVIPEGFLPDGYARVVGFNLFSDYWSSVDVDEPVTTFSFVPGTSDYGLTISTWSTSRYLPSDIFTSKYLSKTDSKAHYKYSNSHTISPYLNDVLNPEFIDISASNAFSDLNGEFNTSILKTSCANVMLDVWRHFDNASSLQWYVPSLGELACFMVRFGVINNTIKAITGNSITSTTVWSSTEAELLGAWALDIECGFVSHELKERIYDVISFAILYPVLPKLISFKISSELYYTSENMTWEEWVSSRYNKRGWYITDNKIGSGVGVRIIDASPSDIIIENRQYEVRIESSSGGGSND